MSRIGQAVQGVEATASGRCAPTVLQGRAGAKRFSESASGVVSSRSFRRHAPERAGDATCAQGPGVDLGGFGPSGRVANGECALWFIAGEKPSKRPTGDVANGMREGSPRMQPLAVCNPDPLGVPWSAWPPVSRPELAGGTRRLCVFVSVDAVLCSRVGACPSSAGRSVQSPVAARSGAVAGGTVWGAASGRTLTYRAGRTRALAENRKTFSPWYCAPISGADPHGPGRVPTHSGIRPHRGGSWSA